jgi:anti-sigma B factor antagonist
MPEPTDDLTIASTADGATATLTLVGELDAHTAPALADAIETAVAAGATAIVVDANGLSFCDSSGIQVLIQARERLVPNGGTVALVGVQRSVEKVLAVTGLLELFTQ